MLSLNSSMQKKFSDPLGSLQKVLCIWLLGPEEQGSAYKGGVREIPRMTQWANKNKNKPNIWTFPPAWAASYQSCSVCTPLLMWCFLGSYSESLRWKVCLGEIALPGHFDKSSCPYPADSICNILLGRGSQLMSAHNKRRVFLFFD